MFEEIHSLSRLGRNRLAFVDDNFMGPGQVGSERANELADRILSSGVDLSFRIMCRVTDVDLNTLQNLKRAGLRRVHLGVESFSKSQLARFGKGVLPHRIVQAIGLVRSLGIECTYGLILWDPESTLDELRSSLRGLRGSGVESLDSLLEALTCRLILFPGAPLANRYAEQLTLSLDTDSSSALKDRMSQFFTYPWFFEDKLVARAYESLLGWLLALRGAVPHLRSYELTNELLSGILRFLDLVEGEADDLTIGELLSQLKQSILGGATA